MTYPSSPLTRYFSDYQSIAGPAPTLKSEERFERALRYAVQAAGQWIEDGEVFLPSIEPGMKELEGAFIPVWERKGLGPNAKSEFSHFEFPDWAWEKWSGFLNATMRHRKMVFDRVGHNLMNGKPVPDAFRIIAAANLMGHVKPLPAERGKPSLKHRDTLISEIAKRVSLDFGYPVGANKATFQKRDVPPKCGCTCAAAALHAWGVKVSFRRANDICANPRLPVEKAEETGDFEPHHLFICEALMGNKVQSEVVLSRARARLLEPDSSTLD